MGKRTLLLLTAVCVAVVNLLHAQEPELTTARFDSLYKVTEQVRGVNPDSAITLATNLLISSQHTDDLQLTMQAELLLGYSYYSNNQFDKALQHLNKSLSVAQQLENNEFIALTLNRIGNTYQLQGLYAQAMHAYKEALTINQELNDRREIARTLVNIGTVNSMYGNYQRSIDNFLRALSIYQSLNDRDGIAWASLSTARLFKRLGLNEKALEYAESAFEHYKAVEQRTGNTTGVTLSLGELGNIYHQLGMLPKALEHIEMVLSINKKNHNVHGEAANRLTLGIINFEQGNYSQAESNLQQALALKRSVSDSIDMAVLYRYLGEISIQKGNWQQAQQMLSRSLDMAKEHKLLSETKDAYLSLFHLCQSTGKLQKAIDYYTDYTEIKDSINAGEISKLELQYEFEQKEKETELINQQKEAVQKAKLQRQQIITVFVLVALVLSLVLVIVIWRFYKAKQRINQVLVAQNHEITEQKHEIEAQKDEIERQRDIATKQRDQIAEQQKLITDSIRYASRIQTAVLPPKSVLEQAFPNNFLIFKPKNIVSGDFYWVGKLPDGRTLIAAADCTGHGVPGAFMSMLGITHLREIVSTWDGGSAGDLLNALRTHVIGSLNQNGTDNVSVDGMDMALVLINEAKTAVEFAGAYHSVFLCREATLPVDEAERSRAKAVLTSDKWNLLEFKGNRMPIGFHIMADKAFDTITFPLQKGDRLYLFSDGYADQFGGPTNAKLTLGSFRQLVLDIQPESLPAQHQLLNEHFEQFMGEQKQVDDILVMGIEF